MRQNEGYFTGTGNTKLYWRCWLPDSQPKAIIVAVHGLGEHISRYTNLVNNVVPRGYAVYGLDHRGHGASAGAHGLGSFGQGGFGALVDDMAAIGAFVFFQFGG